jgi:hypothetical protein
MTENTILIGVCADHSRINIGVPYSHAPLDVDSILAELDQVHDKAQLYLARTKFAYDISMLRAALYALATDKTMAEAINEIENLSHAEDTGNVLLHGYLASRGWRPYDPLQGDEILTEKKGEALGPSQVVQIGKKHSGDVIVSLSTGTTLLAEARSAYEFDWVDVWTKQVHQPRTYDRWWFTHNYKAGLGYDPRNEKATNAYNDLTIPAVPADLDALIARVKTEES